MWLQLIGAVACLAMLTSAARAQSSDSDPWEGEATSKLSLYADDDETTVITSVVDGSVRLPQPVVIGGHFLVDTVSTASVDVVAAATERWTENRYEGGARAQVRISELEVGLGFVRSGENDWLSHSIQLSVGRELAQRNARLQVAYGFTDNLVGRNEDPNFERHLDAHTLELGLTQLYDRRTLLGVTYTMQRSSGFQSSPYRYVFTTSGVSRPETHPGTRLRQALTLRVVRAVGSRMGWDTSYRLYIDDWGVMSHTLSSALKIELGEHWDGRVRARGYSQGAADFYRESYDMPATFMSSDRELSTFWDVGGGAKLTWHSDSDRWFVDAKVDGIYYQFLDFARLEGRVALVTSMGARLTW